MATKTGSIMSRPTLKAYANIKIEEDVDNFLKGTGNISYTSSTECSAILYGFDFRKLATLNDVKITGFSVSITCKSNATFNSSTTLVSFRLVKDFTEDYVDLGDGSINMFSGKSGHTTSKTYVKTESDLSNTLSWMNSNISSLISGYSSNTFGIRIYLANADISNITITVTYTYYEEEKLNKIYVGTAQPKAIYVGTQEVKAVYVGTTKVYG